MKKAYVAIALVGVVLAALLLVSIGTAAAPEEQPTTYSTEDFISTSGDTSCLIRCVSYIDITNPTDSDISVSDSNYMRFDFDKQLENYEVYRWETVDHFTEDPIYGDVPYDCISNETKEPDTCYTWGVTQYGTKKVQIDEWVPFDAVGNTLETGETWKLKLVGHKKIYEKVKWGVHFGDYYLDPWWDSDWGYKKAISLNESENLVRTGEFVTINLSDDSDIVARKGQADFSDIRITNSAEDTEIDSQVYNYNATSYYYVVFPAEVDANDQDGDAEYYIYYGCPSCSTPSYDDCVSVSGSGDWQINNTDSSCGNPMFSMGWQSLDANAGGWNALSSPDQYNPEYSSSYGEAAYGLVTHPTYSINITFRGDSESDDLCTKFIDGPLVAMFMCEAGEDSNTNGVCESGETCVEKWYYADYWENTVRYGSNAPWCAGISGWYHANNQDGFQDSGAKLTWNNYSPTVTNGYIALDMHNASTKWDRFTFWNESYSAAADDYVAHGTSVGVTIGDAPGCSFGSNDDGFSWRSIWTNTSWDAPGSALNYSWALDEERRYDNPLGIALGAEENQSAYPAGNSTLIGSEHAIQQPMSFYGTVNEASTTLDAYIDGDLVASTSVDAVGEFGLFDVNGTQEHVGELIIFKVGAAVKKPNATFWPGQTMEVDLVGL